MMRRFPKQLIQMILLGGLSSLIIACHALLNPPAQGTLPPCVNDSCRCGDFISQPLAQKVLKTYQGDPYKLDNDGNGRACESLPAETPSLDAPGPASNNPHLVLGNPSNANSTNPDNYLLEKPQYVVGYDRDRNTARWVSWHLDASWLGNVERQDNFRPDTTLPQGFYRVAAEDYRGSGYDRGHLVPSADRTNSPKDNSATFLMTNIVPQAANNNRGTWRELEEHERDLVYQYDRDLYILAGAYGAQGTIGRRTKITVPTRIWKVIVVLDQPGIGINGVSKNTQIIAVDMPNQNDIAPDWKRYQTSIDSIELATGLDLLSNVPQSIQAVIEARTSKE